MLKLSIQNADILIVQVVLIKNYKQQDHLKKIFMLIFLKSLLIFAYVYCFLKHIIALIFLKIIELYFNKY